MSSWHVAVEAGPARVVVRKLRCINGCPSPRIILPRRACRVARDDKEARQDWVMRGFRQFDAPVSIVITVDKALANDTIAHFDCGAVTYGLVLAAWSKGLGTVINGQGIMQSSVVRENANIPDDQVIMTCVAIGYPDEEFVANHVQSRRSVDDTVASFVGFD